MSRPSAFRSFQILSVWGDKVEACESQDPESRLACSNRGEYRGVSEAFNSLGPRFTSK